jgi:hypothetical protein
MASAKSWASSKGIWLGTAVTILGALQSAFQQYPLEPKTQGFILMGIGLAINVIRVLTDGPVTLESPSAVKAKTQ